MNPKSIPNFIEKTNKAELTNQQIKRIRHQLSEMSKIKAPKASTIRFKSELQTALDRISDHLDRPKNKLVNQAVAEFLE